MDIKNNKIENYKSKSIISLSKVTTIILLENKEDIVSVSLDSKIIIFELKFYKTKLTINNLTNNTLLDVKELKNNKLVVTSWDNTIIILQLFENNSKYEKIQTLNKHESFINAIIEIKFENENYLASSSTDASVIIWKLNKNNEKYDYFKTLKNTNNQMESIIECKKHKELISSSHQDFTICFYDIKTFNFITKIEEIMVNRCIRALQIINDDILICAGYFFIYLFNIENHQLINNIEYNDNIEYNCVYLMKNGNILISEIMIGNDEYSNICQYSFDEQKKNLIKISSHQKMHKSYITSIIELENNEIITCGYDNLIKIWNYKSS